MPGRLRRTATVTALGGLAVLLAGCPLEFQKEPAVNRAPFTFFDVSPADTTFSNEAFFTWLGTDLDSDVVAYQYQLVQTDSLYYYSAGQQGTVLRSVVPRREFTGSETDTYVWTDRTLDNSQSFSELDDGWYEMRARSIDDGGNFSDPPALRRFYVFFDDVPPTPIIITPRPGGTTAACARLPSGLSAWTFFLDAEDQSRNAETPRSALEYSYQLRGRSSATCTTHLTDGFTEWRRFPADGLPVEVGNSPPTVYSDLFDPNCGWDFTFRVRDPAGNVASTTDCCITKGSGCQ